MLFTPIATDTVKEKYHGITLEIGRHNSAEFRRKFRRLTKPYKRQIDKDELPEDLSIELMCRAMIGTVLVGWEGAKTADGSVYEFTEQNALDLLIDDVDCREFISEVASNLSLFLDQQDEEAKKKP